jgi:hypothetical protein
VPKSERGTWVERLSEIRFGMLGARPLISYKGDPKVKILLGIAAVLVVPACSYAQAKPCEELKTEIAAKLDAKGVKGYSLDIVAKDADAGDGKVVGTCEAGAKKIVYKKGAAAAEAPAKAPSGL